MSVNFALRGKKSAFLITVRIVVQTFSPPHEAIGNKSVLRIYSPRLRKCPDFPHKLDAWMAGGGGRTWDWDTMQKRRALDLVQNSPYVVNIFVNHIRLFIWTLQKKVSEMLNFEQIKNMLSNFIPFGRDNCPTFHCPFLRKFKQNWQTNFTPA